MTGGGSGGHITPILAVAAEIKQLEPTAEISYIGQRGDTFSSIVNESTVIDKTYAVRAGKFRRYHGEGLKQLLDLPTVGKNLRDAAYVAVGLWQSFWLLGKLKPDVVFTRGGFVSVPVALAAALRHIPYLTHDSDAVPSLANRIIAPWASRHAVALPVSLYPYPRQKTVDVGVPVAREFQPVDERAQAAYRKALGLEGYKHLLLVTGGGLGAEIINDALVANALHLLTADPDLCIVHTVGHRHEANVSAAYTKVLPPPLRKRVIVRDYVNDLYRYSGAADVIVARGGATTFAEFAQQGRACIIIPNPVLTGGHQTKNAQAYADKQAVVLLEEKRLAADKTSLGEGVLSLLQHPDQRKMLAQNLQAFARPDSARELAALLLKIQKGGSSHVAATHPE